MADHDLPMAVGDSIAVGFIRHGGLSGNSSLTPKDTDADAAAGRTPQEVLSFITSRPKGYFNNKDVILSTGVSNNPDEIDLVPRQIAALKEAGANVHLIGVGTKAGQEAGKRFNLNRFNERLAADAKQGGVPFIGGLPAVVHPPTTYYENATARFLLPNHERVVQHLHGLAHTTSENGGNSALRDAIKQKWIAAGVSEAGAEGIVRRAFKESGLNPLALGDKGSSFGLYQEHAERMKGLAAYAAANGKSITDPMVQTDYAIQEAKSGDPIAARHWNEYANATTPEAGETAFTRYFERPKTATSSHSLGPGETYGPAMPSSESNIGKIITSAYPQTFPDMPARDTSLGEIVTKPMPLTAAPAIHVASPGVRPLPSLGGTIERALANISRTR